MNTSTARMVAPWIPYVTVGWGLYIMHSAWAAAISYHLGMGLILAIEHRWGLVKELPKGHNLVIIVAGVILGAVGGMVLYVLWPWLGISAAYQATLVSLGLESDSFGFFIVYFIAVNAWLEEIYWRGYLGSNGHLPELVDILFGGYHLLVLAFFINGFWQLLSLIVLISAGFIWRQMTRWSKGLLAPVLSHIAADTSIIITAYYFSLH